MNRHPLGTIVLLALCASLAACAQGRRGGASPPGPSGHADAKDEAAVATAIRDQLTRTKGDYRIQPSDLIQITVYQDPDLARKVRVGQNGTVFMPLVGAVKIGGLTLLEAGELLADRLKHYLVSPQVSLFIEEYGNKQVYVLGEVTKPGSYPIPAESRLSALEAISVAGGFTAIAGVDNTRVLRNVGGRDEVIVVDVTSITKNGQKEKDILLQPNDVVFVPQSFF